MVFERNKCIWDAFDVIVHIRSANISNTNVIDNDSVKINSSRGV